MDKGNALARRTEDAIVRVGSEVRLTGTVQPAEGDEPAEGGVVIRRAWLHQGRGNVGYAHRGTAFDLLTDEGRRVRVELELEAQLVPMTTASGRWSAIEGDEVAVPFRKRAPAPHVSVNIGSCVLRPGDRVEVLGHVTDVRQVAEGEAYRGEALVVPARLEATMVAAGADPTGALDDVLAAAARRRSRRSAFSRVFGALGDAARFTFERLPWVLMGVAVAVGGVPWLLGARGWFAAWVAALAPGGVAACTYWLYRRREIANFHDGERRYDWLHVWGGVIFMPPVVALLPFLVTLWCLLGALVVTFAQWRSSRLIRLLLETTPHPSDLPDGAWGSSSGVVSASSSEAAAVLELGPAEKLGVELPKSDEEPALWSSTPEDGRRRTWVGGRALAVGRVLRRDVLTEPRLSPTGPESLVMFAAGPGEDPRKELQAVLVRRHVVRAVLVAMGVASLVEAALLLPRHW